MTAFCSASDPGRSWGWLPSTQANGSFAPLCEFGIGRLTERLGEVNRETEAFWPFNSRYDPSRSGQDSLTRERADIGERLGHFGLDMTEIERQMAEWQAPHVLAKSEETFQDMCSGPSSIPSAERDRAGDPYETGPWPGGDPYGFTGRSVSANEHGHAVIQR